MSPLAHSLLIGVVVVFWHFVRQVSWREKLQSITGDIVRDFGATVASYAMLVVGVGVFFVMPMIIYAAHLKWAWRFLGFGMLPH